MISYFRDDRLCEADSFLSVVKPDDTECPMIAAVGAGGKTSTLRRLAEELAADGEKGNCSYNNSYERRDDSMELCG